MYSQYWHRASAVAGLITGAGAYVAGFLLTRHFVELNGQNVNLAVDVPSDTIAAWYHYNAQFIDITQSVEMGRQSASVGGTSLIAASTDPHFQILTPLIALIVILAGALVSAQRRPRQYQSIINGAYITLGYVPALLVGSLIWRVGTGGGIMSASMHPSYGGILIYGTLFATACGSIGGFLYFLVSRL